MSVRTIKVGDTPYEFDPSDITNEEGIAIEKVMGMTFDRWNAALADGSMMAMTALVWLLQRRDNPALRFSDVHFKVGDLGFVGGDDAEAPASGPSEIVPGGLRAEFDEADPTAASGASTTDASPTSPPSPTSSTSDPVTSTS